MDEIKSNSANSDSGHSYNIQRLQSIPHDANSEDIFRCERAIGALEKMMNSSQDITNRLSEKRKNCYLPSLDLVPGGKSTVRYVEVKLQALDEIKETLFHILDNRDLKIPWTGGKEDVGLTEKVWSEDAATLAGIRSSRLG